MQSYSLPALCFGYLCGTKTLPQTNTLYCKKEINHTRIWATFYLDNFHEICYYDIVKVVVYALPDPNQTLCIWLARYIPWVYDQSLHLLGYEVPNMKSGICLTNVKSYFKRWNLIFNRLEIWTINWIETKKLIWFAGNIQYG